MKDDNKHSRKSFLRTAGSTALFTALGLHLTGCASDSMDSDGGGGGGGGTTNPPGNTLPEGVTVSGNQITLDLSASGLSHLSNEGQILVLNASSTNILAVNVDGQTIRAFTSFCTHQSCNNGWSYNNQTFTCRGSCGHGSQFNSGGEWVSGADGQTGLNTGDLDEYGVNREGNTVTITK